MISSYRLAFRWRYIIPPKQQERKMVGYGSVTLGSVAMSFRGREAMLWLFRVPGFILLASENVHITVPYSQITRVRISRIPLLSSTVDFRNFDGETVSVSFWFAPLWSMRAVEFGRQARNLIIAAGGAVSCKFEAVPWK